MLAPLLSSQACGKVLASKDRHLLHRGTLWLLDSRARPSTELHTFLFTDMLLLTERKPCKREVSHQQRSELGGGDRQSARTCIAVSVHCHLPGWVCTSTTQECFPYPSLGGCTVVKDSRLMAEHNPICFLLPLTVDTYNSLGKHLV